MVASVPRATQPVSLIPPPGRIVVKAVNWLGDLVISLPALKAVRHAFPQARLAVLVRQELAGFFDGARWIDEIIPYTHARGIRGLPDQWRIVAAIRRRRFDLAVLLPNSFRSALWMAAARVPWRTGYATDGRGFLLTHKVQPAGEGLSAHQLHYYLNLLRRTVGIEGAAGDYALDVYDPHREKMAAWLRARRRRPSHRLIAIAPAAAYGPAKEWPAAHYRTLIDLLGERYGAECVLIGSPGERSKCDAIVAGDARGPVVAAGETSIGESIALLSLCDGFAGNDSGSMHVAGALGIPTVGLFGSTNPQRTAPLGPQTRVIYHRIECSPCLERTCRFGHYKCLEQISAQEVADALVALGALHVATR